MSTLQSTLRQRQPLSGALALALGLAAVVMIEVAAGLLTAKVSPRLVLDIVVIGGASVLCFVAPRRALLVLVGIWGALHVILLDFDLFKLGTVEVTLSRAVGIAILVFFGLSVSFPARARTSPSFPRSLRALLAFWLLFVNGALVAGTALAASDLLRLSGSVVLALTAYRVLDTRERFRRLLDVATLGGSLVAAVTVGQFLLAHFAPALARSIFGVSFFSTSYAPGSNNQLFATRVHGTLGGADEAGAFLLVSLGFAVLRGMLRADTARKGHVFLPILLILLGLVSTLSRTAIAGSLVLFFVLSLQRQIRSIDLIELRARLLVMLAVVGAITALVVSPAALHSRLADLNPTTSGASFAQGRASIWHNELAVVRSSDPLHMMIGHGVHSSYAAAGELSPHNVPLWLLVEVGILGFGAYLVFFGSVSAVYVATARSRRFRLEGKTAALGLSLLVAVATVDLFLMTPLSSGSGWYFMIFVGATLRVCSGLPYAPSPR
jgi:hypothetical protein